MYALYGLVCYRNSKYYFKGLKQSIIQVVHSNFAIDDKLLNIKSYIDDKVVNA